ncbi:MULTISPECIES: ATP-dependent zinc metalloprotease FtsH [Pelosinus]|uniref:ATP-dependent zinc metalloprotease FtsH n=1 Tax=Pelosinus fermentans B4 TaxID=1149862 RepID=I9LEF1_9FIRM|nr:MULTISPECIES: ATP-dependent zinc metalloprotease FtsH [Pelosinus]EIW18814.1 ATP-dependent metalloprotease FtsH [Pelosinus fermentans B4]EIW21976.1 ATP-dependent metalloprotease FtsH [Pelosinus fermentans A11]OAM95173.1 peptidase M41 FtsH domain protein [Pelosinus fermentans DSM 17108]SDR24313.1 cell division protease FtsH [Pelosinus fermentans]
MDNKQRSFSAGYLIIAMLATWLFNDLVYKPFIIRETEVSYNVFLQDLKENKINEVILSGDRIVFTLKATENQKETSANVVAVTDPDLVDRLIASGVAFSAQAPTKGLLSTLFGFILPLLPLFLIWYFIFKRMGGGGPNAMSLGKSKAHEISGEMIGIKFSDVGGVGEAEVELREIIEYLKNPEKFSKMGAKLPKGVLLAGSPGTGKTLLAKATAGEAEVPFFFLTGSSFVEMFVGVGAARVRDLFEQAQKKAPCIIFIDEIDAIGQARTSVAGIGGNSEQENTLNQLLAEMDGFAANSGVVIMAATNRPEILDAALIRPGRFDRQIQVNLPTEPGRLEILTIHTRSMPLGDDVNLERLAKITAGFSGAELANLANEAALLAIRQGAKTISMADFDLAIERVVAGLQRKTPLSDAIRSKVSYHEVGHALTAYYLPGTDPVHKISIIPTAKGALGYTMQMPEEDRYLIGENELKARIAVMLGGRAAELIVFQEASTGASNDLERATEMARRMITEFGMSLKLGPVRYANTTGTYLRSGVSGREDLSPATILHIDQEIHRLLDEAQNTAKQILTEHIAVLHEVAQFLKEKEAISGDDLTRIVTSMS